MTRVEGGYKEYKYFKNGSIIGIYVPEYQKDKLKCLRGLSCFPMHTVSISDATNCIQIQPWTLFVNCTNLTEVQFPPMEPMSLIPQTSDGTREKIDVIDLLLNAEGFYK